MLDLSHVAAIAAEIREVLGADEDDQAVADTLDGETDVMGLVDWLLHKQQEALSSAAAAKVARTALQAREARFEARADALKSKLGEVLDAMGIKKLERPTATVSRLAPRASVEITDESSIPSQLCRTKVEPDKAAIKRILEQGDMVPGAQLKTGNAGVMVRVS